jgi:ferredoxin
MTKYKIEQDHENCIGCGACVASCEKFWVMGKDGKASLKGGKKMVEVDDIGCNMDAAQTCPVSVIHIFDLKTKKKMI